MATPQHHASGQGPVPGNPYGAAGGYGQTPAAPWNQAPAPGGYGAPAAPTQVPRSCRACGGQSAEDFKVRSHVGILIMMKFEHLNGPFCRACGIAVVRQMTTRTLCLGWWGPLSLVIFNPFTLVWNLLAYRKFSKLPPSTPAPGRTHLDTGPAVLRRPQAYVTLIPIAWAVWIISQALTHSS
ncbi:hypothetical protein [Streptomyces sp. NRRL F-2580]|uniref:hypothetical protein n=1 Tax=Streptomyces sp. NRRL F-2580 TaxID=1463841 RepID=UPI000ADD5FFF|nr:hypothetical protein [Streptomyces sp. NRRL F-2580]